MGLITTIAWCNATINPWWGCQKVSPGCAHCYAEGVDARFHPGFVETTKDGDGGLAPYLRGVESAISDSLGADFRFGSKVASHWGADAPRRLRVGAAAQEAFRYERRAVKEGRRFRVFCASMADFFEDRRDLDLPRLQFLGVIRRTPHLDWLILTKRPEKVRELLEMAYRAAEMEQVGSELAVWLWNWLDGMFVPANVALGTTVESQDWAVLRLDALLAVPARTHFVSVEPMLGPVDLRPWLGMRGRRAAHELDWVICGGESGSKSRAMATPWAHSLANQTLVAGAAFFMKQLSEATHPKTYESFEAFPPSLQVRQFPAAFDYF